MVNINDKVDVCMATLAIMLENLEFCSAQDLYDKLSYRHKSQSYIINQMGEVKYAKRD